MVLTGPLQDQEGDPAWIQCTHTMDPAVTFGGDFGGKRQ